MEHVPTAPAATSQTEEAPEQSVASSLFIEQYISLRDEILRTKDSRRSLILEVARIAGLFLSAGVVDLAGSGLVVLVYPILVCFFSAEWLHDNGRLGQIQYFLQSEVEPRFGTYPAWQHFKDRALTLLLHLVKSKNRAAAIAELSLHEQKLIARHDVTQLSDLSMPKDLIPFAARGIFLATQLLAIAIGVIRVVVQILELRDHLQQIGLASIEVLLLVADIAAVVTTFAFLRHRRHRLNIQHSSIPAFQHSSIPDKE